MQTAQLRPAPLPPGAALVAPFPKQPACFGGLISIKPKQAQALHQSLHFERQRAANFLGIEYEMMFVI